MKYMGSKRWMLRNGLGHLLQEELSRANRFLDLFTGSGAVAHFAARTPVPVFAYDLQRFSVALADAVVSRDRKISHGPFWAAWRQRAEDWLNARGLLSTAMSELPPIHRFTRARVAQERRDCTQNETAIITRAYGGHYFSQAQALWLDAYRASLPPDTSRRRVALAALIHAASICAAAPGHTAQPFQPTATAKKFLFEAWQRDIGRATEAALEAFCALHAAQIGAACVANANDAALEVTEGDLVFLDPPYSGVHYSRFYHVLETVAHGHCGEVSGVGRYPATKDRPKSDYSVRTKSANALDHLLGSIADRG
jgi:adenine-specific DNA-methyltransferase